MINCHDDKTKQTTLLFDNARWSDFEFSSDGFCSWYCLYEAGMIFYKKVSKANFIEQMQVLKTR